MGLVLMGVLHGLVGLSGRIPVEGKYKEGKRCLKFLLGGLQKLLPCMVFISFIISTIMGSSWNDAGSGLW